MEKKILSRDEFINRKLINFYRLREQQLQQQLQEQTGLINELVEMVYKIEAPPAPQHHNDTTTQAPQQQQQVAAAILPRQRVAASETSDSSILSAHLIAGANALVAQDESM